MAQDLTLKRQHLAQSTIAYAAQFVDALNALLDLKDQRAELPADFDDADFATDPGLTHLTSGMIGTLFDFVIPSMSDAFTDTANSGRNKQILLQVRR